MEQPVHLPSNGKRLFGILHEPAGTPSSVGVVFLNAGPQNRSGPQRIYVHAARRFSDAGITCLRLDLPGVGESEGPFPENHLDCHDPANVRGAVDLLKQRGIRSVVLLGLCVGGRVAVRAGLADDRVAGVVSWSAPIISGAPGTIADAISQAAARAQIQRWSQRVLQPQRWTRLFTSREARAEAANKLGRVLQTMVRPARHDVPKGFAADMRKLVAGTRDFFIAYGERDLGPRAEFEEHVASLADTGRPDRRLMLVPGADHTFTALSTRGRVISETLAWLRERYAVPSTSR